MRAALLLALAALGAAASSAQETEPGAAQVTEPSSAPGTEPEAVQGIEHGVTQGPESSDGCPRGCICMTGVESRLEYECALRGGGALQVTVSARERWLTARCEAPRLPVAAALPRLPFADVIDAKLSSCRAGAGGWVAVLTALGASTAPRRLTLDYTELNGTEPAGGGTGSATLAEQLQGLTALELLKVSGWSGARLPAALAAALPALRDLRLSGDGASEAPAIELEEGSLALPLLTRLELTGVALTRLPAVALRSLPALKKLLLWGNRLTELSAAALAGARALESVDLSNNTRLRVPARLLADLPALREVSLRSCRLTALPADTFAGSRALHTLLLQDNDLTALPAALLRDQEELRWLDLSVNSLEALAPDLFASLTHLEYLNLDRNNLTSLPSGVFSGLRGVQTLLLAHNWLHAVSPGAFGASPSLTRLVLAHNNLTSLCAAPHDPGYWSVTNSPFDALKDSLQYLDLSHNRIQTLCDDWQHLLLKLKSLDLSYNDFTELTDADFNFLSNTVVVDWRHNKITTAHLTDAYVAAEGVEPEAGVAGQGTGAGVLLDDNPLRCDCRLYELARRLAAPATASAASVRGQPACAAPPAFARHALRALPLDTLVCALPTTACPAACACALVPAARELRLTCAAAPPLATWPALPAGATRSSLRLTSAPPASGEVMLPGHVHTLNVSGLGLAAAPRVSGPAPLRLLDLRGNRLRSVEPPADPATHLLLADNELACDCDHAAAVAALQRHKDQVDDWERLQCAPSDARAGGARLRLAGTAAAALCPALPGWLLALLSLAALLAVCCVLACWRWERELRMLLGCCWRRPDDDEEREYDAFVAFAHQDEEWVARELVPRLEGGARPLRLCLHYRDWTVGEYISRQIHTSVANSRRTLVVLSDDFLRSAWASAEFRAAYLAEAHERRTRVLVVMLRPPTPALLEPLPELKAHLKTTTYVQVGSPFFWSLLRKALPPGRERAPTETLDKYADKVGGLDVRLMAGGLVNVAGGGGAGGDPRAPA